MYLCMFVCDSVVSGVSVCVREHVSVCVRERACVCMCDR